VALPQVAFGRDGNFSEVAFRDTVNACLANSIGNMLNRCATGPAWNIRHQAHNVFGLECAGVVTPL
jgi:methionyl-tRNA synthetase